MAYTTEQLDILKAAIAQGATKVEYGDKKVEYRSLADMLRVQALMETELGITPRANKKIYPTFNKGLFPIE